MNLQKNFIIFFLKPEFPKIFMGFKYMVTKIKYVYGFKTNFRIWKKIHEYERNQKLKNVLE